MLIKGGILFLVHCALINGNSTTFHARRHSTNQSEGVIQSPTRVLNSQTKLNGSIRLSHPIKTIPLSVLSENATLRPSPLSNVDTSLRTTSTNVHCTSVEPQVNTSAITAFVSTSAMNKHVTILTFFANNSAQKGNTTEATVISRNTTSDLVIASILGVFSFILLAILLLEAVLSAKSYWQKH